MRVLIADDQALDRSVLRLALQKWDYEVVEAENGTEALRILTDDDAPSLAILDWMMPGLSGPEVCEQIREEHRQRYVYILLLTSKDDKEDVVQGLTAGADDYIVKPVDMHELQVRLRAGRRIIELQEELIATREELRIQATRDFLTGVWNRGMIMAKLDEEMKRAARNGEPIAVIMGDIDHFKHINDTHGHPAGDVVLVEVARRIQASLRGYDAVGRFGGEEFLIICPNTGAQGARALGERIRAAMAKESVSTERASIDVQLSLGVAAHGVADPTDRNQLISLADAALYRAKNNGRNRVEVAEEVAPA